MSFKCFFFEVSRPLVTLLLARSLHNLIEARFARFTHKTQGNQSKRSTWSKSTTRCFESRHKFAVTTTVTTTVMHATFAACTASVNEKKHPTTN